MENKDFSDLSVNSQGNGAKNEPEENTATSNVSSEDIDVKTLDNLQADAIGNGAKNEPEGNNATSNVSYEDIDVDTVGNLRVVSFGNGAENKPQENAAASNVSSKDIDQETLDKLRGDAIGDTMYSQSSVIRTLMQLSDIEWNKRLEEDLCVLWDMTVEKDVCKYLFHLSFPSIAMSILMKYKEPRLIEIIIGILANMCSHSEYVHALNDTQISVIISEMVTDDDLILIQVMRFLWAVTYYRVEDLCFMTSGFIGRICFILTYAKNKELLWWTMRAFGEILEDFKVDPNLLHEDVLMSVLIAYDTIHKKTKYTDSKKETYEMKKLLNVYLQCLLHIALYVSEYSEIPIYEKIMKTDFDKELICQFRSIFKKFTRKEVLLPLDDKNSFYFRVFSIVFPALKLKYDADIFLYLCKITGIVINEDDADDNSCVLLMRYLVSVADVDNLIKDVEKSECNDKCGLFKYLLEYQAMFECKYNYKENINAILEKLNGTNK